MLHYYPHLFLVFLRPSFVGKADTFPEREGNNLFCQQSRHLPRKGKAFCRKGETCIVKLFGNVLFSRFFSLIIPAVLCYDMLVLLYS